MCCSRVHDENVKQRMCSVFCLMEYFLAVWQRSGEKVLQPCLGPRPVTGDQFSQQKQCYRTKCNANGYSKDCRKSSCFHVSCNIDLRASISVLLFDQGSSSLYLEAEFEGTNTQCTLLQWAFLQCHLSLYALAVAAVAKGNTCLVHIVLCFVLFLFLDAAV